MCSKITKFDDLKNVLAAGAPTQRLRDLSSKDPYSGCEILLSGDFASLSFTHILSVFEEVGITKDNLTAEERQFLLSAVTLHIAIKLRQGCFRSLHGAGKILEFLDVSEFKFSEQYLDFIKFWWNQLPNWEFCVFSTLRVKDGEVDYSGTFVRERFIEMDFSEQSKRKEVLVRRDYALAIKHYSTGHIELTPEQTADFLSVQAVLIELRAAKRRLSANMFPGSLSELLQITSSLSK